MQAVELRAGAAPSFDSLDDDAVGSLPPGVMRGQRDMLPHQGPGRRKIPLDHGKSVGAQNHIPHRCDFSIPRLLEVAHPTFRLANVFDGLRVLDEALGAGIHPHGPNAGLGIERIGVGAERFADVVLEQAMDQDHISSGEFLPAGHALPDERAVVHDELHVEALHPAAGLALAAVGLLDVAQPLAEGEIRLLDRILQERPVDLVVERINESCVALELGKAERRTKRPDERIHDVGDDVLGVVEFDPGYEVRVAGNIGDHEASRFGLRKHGEDLPARQQRHGLWSFPAR